MLFWHATCDLSRLLRPQRTIQGNCDTPEALLGHLKPSFDMLEEMHGKNSYDNCVLKSPPIFWHKWNKINGDPNWQTINDQKMHEQVEYVNKYIGELNNRLNYRSLDLFVTA